MTLLFVKIRWMLPPERCFVDWIFLNAQEQEKPKFSYKKPLYPTNEIWCNFLAVFYTCIETCWRPILHSSQPLFERDPQKPLYWRYSSAHSAGSFRTFADARRGQYGARLWEILGGILRTILPIAAHGASTFLDETVKAKVSGSPHSWGDAAKAAHGYTADNVVTNSLQKLKRLSLSRAKAALVVPDASSANPGIKMRETPRKSIKGKDRVTKEAVEDRKRKLNFSIFNL